MSTQTAQPAKTYPQSSNGGFKTLFAIIAGVFLFYAVKSHLITDAFCAFLDLIFDSYSIQSNSIVPDIVILILAALLLMGIWHCLKFYPTVTIVSLIIWIVAAVYISDVELTKKTKNNGLDLFSKIENAKKGE